MAISQDIITLKTGEEIKAKVNEIESTDIKYKKFENLSGPTYYISKEKVLMIKYENGTKEIISTIEASAEQTIPVSGELVYTKGRVYKDKVKLRPFEVKKTMEPVPAALGQYKAGRTYNTLAIIFLSASIIQSTSAVVQTINGQNATSTYIFAVVDLGIGYAFSFISANKMEKSVTLYNSGVKKQSLGLGLTHDGIGLCLKF